MKRSSRAGSAGIRDQKKGIRSGASRNSIEYQQPWLDIYALQHWTEDDGLLTLAVRLGTATLGSEHPDPLGNKQNLALVYWGQGRYHEATRLMEKVVELGTKVMGEDHRDTQMAVVTLEKWREEQQEGEEEEEEHEEQ